MIALLALLSAATAQDCAFRTPSDDLVATLDAAETAYANLDVDGFLGGMDELAMVMPCLSDAYSPAAASRVHLMMGLRAFTEGDEGRAQASMTASRRADASGTIPEALVPDGHTLRRMHERVDLSQPDAVEPVAPPKSGSLRFDGVEGQARPTDRATLLQVFDAAGEPIAAGYAYPGQPLPWYDAAPLPRPSEQPADQVGQVLPALPPAPRKGLSPTTLAGAGLTVAGVASLGLSMSAAGRMARTGITEDDLRSAWAQNQAFGYAGYTLFGLGLTGVGVGFAL